MRSNYALVFNRDEFDTFFCRYKEHIDHVLDHIDAIDASWGERIFLSVLEISKKRLGVNLYEYAFLPSNLSLGISELHFEEYVAAEAECELLIRQDKGLIWRELNGQDIIALFLPPPLSCYSEKEYMDTFRNLVGQYLPCDFDYSSHIGLLRVCSGKDNEWGFERADAETYVNSLLVAKEHGTLSIADTDDDMKLPF